MHKENFDIDSKRRDLSKKRINQNYEILRILFIRYYLFQTFFLK
jgi:hypothetical protein